jgi:hypothetical protein
LIACVVMPDSAGSICCMAVAVCARG